MASTIKVDNVQNQPGTNIINKCSVTTTVGAGAGETVNVCAATVNLGRSGGTVNLTCGATQSGFGRTGTVDWDTASIKTAEFTAVSGNGYFVNTTGGTVKVNLPAGSAGDIVGLKDYAGTWGSNAVTLAPNGSENIGGATATDPTVANEGGSLLLVYVDATQGWLTTQQSVTASPSGTPIRMVASGGTPCTGAICGDYKIHTFTGPGTFTVCSISPCGPLNVVSYAVVAGGGGGSGDGSGGGGAGGFREGKEPGDPYTASPLDSTTALPVAATGYAIAVGAAGTAITSPPWTINAGAGGVSTFSTITSDGGGGGGNGAVTQDVKSSSGGGGRGSPGGAGAGNTPPTTPPQGTSGAAGSCAPGGNKGSGGGGGATVAGGSGSPANNGGAGGTGAGTGINPSPTYGTPGPSGPLRYFAGGGGGAAGPGANTGGVGGAGGGGQGPGPEPSVPMTPGTINTGGGGGGGQGGPHGPLAAAG